jgi:hypothetical protein
MRKHTVNLLQAFFTICNDKQNKTGLKRIALGLAISLEGNLNLILRDSQGVYTKDSPLFSEIAAAFREVIEKGWIKEMQVTEDDKFLYYSDYGKYIRKTGLSVYTNPENIEIQLKLFPWPLGPNWFLLTAKGEEFVKSINNKSLEIENTEKSWDVFISFAGEDRKNVAEPLALSLRKEDLKVWYDKFELKIGDRLLQKIDQGLINSRYGIVILSPSFFKKGWPQLELDGLIQKEIEGKKVILPIWHEVIREDVIKYSPILAGKLAGETSKGIDFLTKELLNAME